MASIIFTGLDDILLPMAENSYEQIAVTVTKLQQNNIPLIPITKHTRAEVEVLARKIGLTAPFVVEQGSGVFIPQDNHDFRVLETETINGYCLHQLGCSYTEARAALKAVQEEIGKILRGFGDLEEGNIQTIMDVSSSAAKRAKSREFSEYFLTPSRLEIKKLQTVAQEYGFKIVPEGKLSLVVGSGADQKRAITWLEENYQISGGEQVTTIGLGTIKHDLALLEAVDVPIVIPTHHGVDSSLLDREWQIASDVGSPGWINAIAQFV